MLSIINFFVALIPLFGFVMNQYVVVDMLWPSIGKRLAQRDASRLLVLAMELALRALLAVVARE